MPISAIIFDMDGLMLDSETVYRLVFNRAAQDCSLQFPHDIHDQLLGRNSADMKSIMHSCIPDKQQYDNFFDRYRHHHNLCFAQPPALKQGLLDLLDFLEARNIPKVVATSTPRKTAIARLESCNLLHRFLSVSCGDEVQKGKPAPDLFLKAAQTIPAKPAHCLVLEDSEAGVTGAHAAGMTVYMIPDTKQPSPTVQDRAHAIHQSLTHVQDYLRDNL